MCVRNDQNIWGRPIPSMTRKCASKVIGCGGVAFMTLLASAENIETYLFGTAPVWMIGGTFLAMCWAWEHFCHNGSEE